MTVPADEINHEKAMQRHIEWCHQAAIETQNPVYAWRAIMTAWWEHQRLNHDTETPSDFVIPDWCVQYLGECAQSIAFLASGHDVRKSYEPGEQIPTISPDVARSAVPEVIGLSRQGFDAFKSFRSDREKLGDYVDLKEYQESGLTYEKALQKMADEKSRSEDTVRKRTSEGKRLFNEKASGGKT